MSGDLVNFSHLRVRDWKHCVLARLLNKWTSLKSDLVARQLLQGGP